MVKYSWEQPINQSVIKDSFTIPYNSITLLSWCTSTSPQMISLDQSELDALPRTYFLHIDIFWHECDARKDECQTTVAFLKCCLPQHAGVFPSNHPQNRHKSIKLGKNDSSQKLPKRMWWKMFPIKKWLLKNWQSTFSKRCEPLKKISIPRERYYSD